MISVIIPAKNEAERLDRFVPRLAEALSREQVRYEIIVVDDVSSATPSDGSPASSLAFAHWKKTPGVICLENPPSNHGFGRAIRSGLERAQGDLIAIMMADGSDRPSDLIHCYRKFLEGYDCVFGSRFVRGGTVTNYPWRKYLLNRAANLLISVLFRVPHNDITNAFKCYSRKVIQRILPEVHARHFEITVELPLKALRNGKKLATVPISWTGDPKQESTFRISRIARPYLETLLEIYRDKKHERS